MNNNQILSLIKNNNYIKFCELTDENINKYDKYSLYFKQCMKLNNVECFNKIIDVVENLNIDKSRFGEITEMAYNIYKKTKNDYYLNILINNNYHVYPSKLHILIDYDINIFNKYVDDFINKNDYIWMMASDLLQNKYFEYFLCRFNKLNNHNKTEIIKKYVYKIDNWINYGTYTIAFEYFFTHPDYDFCKYELFNYLVKYIKFDYLININIYINYILKYNEINKVFDTQEIISLLLIKLLDDKHIDIFINIFNKLNCNNKINFVRNKIYLVKDWSDINNILEYFIKDDKYIYYKIMNPNNLVKHLLSNRLKPKIINQCIEQLINNPVNLNKSKYINKNELYICNIKYWAKKINTINKKLVINSSKTPILKYVFAYNKEIDDNYQIIIYICHKIGYDVDMYYDVSVDAIHNIFKRSNKLSKSRIKLIKNLISCVQIGRYIGQEIPDHLKDKIYEICNGYPQIDHHITDDEMKALLNKAK